MNPHLGELVHRMRQQNQQIEQKVEQVRHEMRRDFEDYHKKNMLALEIAIKKIKDNTESIKAFQRRRDGENTGKNN